MKPKRLYTYYRRILLWNAYLETLVCTLMLCNVRGGYFGKKYSWSTTCTAHLIGAAIILMWQFRMQDYRDLQPLIGKALWAHNKGSWLLKGEYIWANPDSLRQSSPNVSIAEIYVIFVPRPIWLTSPGIFMHQLPAELLQRSLQIFLSAATTMKFKEEPNNAWNS